MNGFGLVFCDVMTYVSGRGYDSILQSVWHRHKARWHHGNVFSSLMIDYSIVKDFFVCLLTIERFKRRENYDN